MLLFLLPSSFLMLASGRGTPSYFLKGIIHKWHMMSLKNYAFIIFNYDVQTSSSWSPTDALRCDIQLHAV